MRGRRSSTRASRNIDRRSAAIASDESKPVVVYDGECNFCRREVARIQSMDRAGCFEYVPRQTPDLERRFPQIASADFNTGMRFIAPDGRVSVGADAVYEIARRLPRTRWIAWTYRVPVLHHFARAVYAWIAAHRFKLTGRCDTGACETGPTK